MKILVLFGMIAIPAVAVAQYPTQPENAPVREIASNAPGKSAIDGRDIVSRATATSATATRATTAPVLDGKTDDPAWQNAQVIDQFLEYEPTKGAETRFKTEVRVTYDDNDTNDLRGINLCETTEVELTP